MQSDLVLLNRKTNTSIQGLILFPMKDTDVVRDVEVQSRVHKTTL